jgi:hypothetical protein
VGLRAADAALPEVSFDVTPVAACRDVTPAEFAQANPDERLLQVQIQVSALIRSGSEDDLLQYFYEFESSKQTFRFVDYSPKTTLASDLVGNVTVEKKAEKTNGIGVTVSGPIEWPVKVAGSGEAGAKSLDSLRYELVPPMTAIASSGTMQGGYGVYFKLKPSRSTSLEGAREFSLTFRVPKSWRADGVLLSCTASGVQRGVVPPFDQPNVVCGERRFMMALYSEGDASAKAAAEHLVHAESELRKTLSANRKEIERRFYPTVAHRVGVLLDVIPADLLDSWAEHLLYGGEWSGPERLPRPLPNEVQQAVAAYRVARREFTKLGTARTSEVQ